ncbi:MAG: DUF2177 family protein [Polyangiaceae bacterium]|nr:DUF2177 family protein [Polyangiaceae bacterium]
MNQIKLYAGVFWIYVLVDVGYQLLFGMQFTAAQYEAAGMGPLIASPPRYPFLFFLFFVAITIANVELAVKPALEKRSLGLALRNGAIIGFTTYGTLAWVNTWTFKDFPVLVMFEIMFEGLCFSTVASGLTTRWRIRAQGSANDSDG